ncbi:putative bifunctional diguanylate cyclase/phosphodiesterase [Novosphingobium aerophilum]|uniref:EAL domain-containing protein n=1 Tax=Novosphingobium aerophilum TaxID=2839843 RepID=A0A7X1KAW9_9SPHN|nr:EAL domain-containing protein [Novosphingobium aerophilum]MBC2650599.1 EAL domain-containing protein [Novosphingobium aerophilum]
MRDFNDPADQPVVARSVSRADRDLMALAIGVAAIIMFIGTGANVMPDVVQALQGVGLPPDRLLSNALLLNIALIIFGLRRYRDLQEEVRERRMAEERARELAEHDPLTGCLNRRAIASATDALIAGSAERGEHVGFLMIDVDNFKRINDANGHSVGDNVLQACAARIADLLPARGLLARLGGDEFACVVPFAAGMPEPVEDFARRITLHVARPVPIGHLELEVTVSVGIARSDAHAEANAQALLHMADIAMYQAKKTGKNNHCWFDPAMEKDLRERHELETALRAAIPAGEFVPYYQQQIDIETGRITGFEMLARWNSPHYGHIGPEQFIAIAEEIGVIDDLSEGLIRQALRDAREWDPSITLAINVSPVQLRDPWFAQKLIKLLVEANFPASRLEVEITETCLHDNIQQVRTLIASLKNQGMTVSLDDFGSGYSSLAQLQSLPFDRLKIDRSFVSPMSGCTDSATIVRVISSLGEGLGLPITAEGVESAEIARQLRDLGNMHAQGYLYGRPESGSETLARLADMGLTAKTRPTERHQRPPLSDVA